MQNSFRTLKRLLPPAVRDILDCNAVEHNPRQGERETDIQKRDRHTDTVSLSPEVVSVRIAPCSRVRCRRVIQFRRRSGGIVSRQISTSLGASSKYRIGTPQLDNQQVFNLCMHIPPFVTIYGSQSISEDLAACPVQLVRSVQSRLLWSIYLRVDNNNNNPSKEDRERKLIYMLSRQVCLTSTIVRANTFCQSSRKRMFVSS